MSDELKIRVNGFRAIADAEIALNGITVVSGENGCGKSTLSKLLYYTFKTANEYDEYINYSLAVSVDKILDTIVNVIKDLDSLLKPHLTEKGLIRYTAPKPALDTYSAQNIKLKKLCTDYPSILKLTGDIVSPYANNDTTYATYQYRSLHILSGILIENGKDITPDLHSWEQIADELSSLINDLFEHALRKTEERNIDLLDQSFLRFFEEDDIKEKFNLYEYNACITDRKSNRILNLSSVSQALYIDTPMAAGLSDGFPHWKDLNDKLKQTNLNATTKENIVQQLIAKDILHGSIQADKTLNERFEYQRQDGLKVNLLNCATGIKSFAILQLLLKNGFLNSKTMLIIDEPEAHLHPQWIVEYARMLVLLNKEIGVKFFIATHNPDMISAIKYISEKEEVSKRLNFYLAERMPDYTYSYKGLGTDIDEIFGSFNIAIDRINQYGVVEDEIL